MKIEDLEGATIELWESDDVRDVTAWRRLHAVQDITCTSLEVPITATRSLDRPWIRWVVVQGDQRLSTLPIRMGHEEVDVTFNPAFVDVLLPEEKALRMRDRVPLVRPWNASPPPSDETPRDPPTVSETVRAALRLLVEKAESMRSWRDDHDGRGSRRPHPRAVEGAWTLLRLMEEEWAPIASRIERAARSPNEGAPIPTLEALPDGKVCVSLALGPMGSASGTWEANGDVQISISLRMTKLQSMSGRIPMEELSHLFYASRTTGEA